ncbi:MAG: DNA cytosine methyltransferase [Bacillota bacterium]|nr:DNA cytosine methyltransferase [Bacillota bacterium]
MKKYDITKESCLETPLTYISLFSGAGVGCFGFKQNGFECIATNELIPRRLDIQKINDKCKYETGYISGDITLNETKNEIKREVIFWQEKHGVAEPDVLIATPPCQGMSVANHKKSKNEINRNSLVMESIYLVDEIKPKVFMFENVAAFLKTACMDKDDQIMSIGDAIDKYLSNDYTIQSKVINFKNYGANSSRTRTLVIGVSKKYANEFSPEELFPAYTDEKTLSEVIGYLPRLKTMGEFSKDDFLHSFRSYDKRMRCWISDLKEGESAFDNTDPKKRPHQIKNGVIVPNKNKNGDKYTRQYWDKVAPCIHTRNDQLASQGTVHPEDDRVFSIREVMLMMSVPSEFKWFKEDLTELNKLTQNEKIKKLKTQEINIRQSLGEAVPTGVFFQVAQNIKNALSRKSLKHKDVMKLIKDKNLFEHYNLMQFLKENQEIYTVNTLSMIAEYSNAAREKNSAYYTDKMLLHNIYSILPEFENYKKISVLEPSVGVGSFLPLIAKKYSHVDEIIIDCIDLSEEAIDILEFMVKLYDLGDNVRLNYIVNDFLKHEMDYRYDLIIGNPPFSKMTIKKKEVANDFVNYKSKNLSSYFLEKSLKNADYVVMIMPKNLLNTTEFNETRDYISQFRINNIVDFGEYGFKGVLVETICLSIDTTKKPNKTLVSSLPMDISKIQNQSYVTSNKFPYWIIYRNDYFDNFVNNLELNVFEVFRDRQLTNANMKATTNDKVRVIKSRNITDDGKIIDIENYDAYIDRTALNSFSVSKYIDKENVYLTPNMTYKTRVMKKPKGTIVNGSVAILIPKFNKKLTKEEMNFFASNEYREYMQIARNYQTRTLNVDNNSVYFYGIRKE